MLIKEDLKLPDSKSKIISPKENYLQAINALILKFKRKLSLIQKQKKPQNIDEQIMDIKQFYNEQLQDFQQKNKNNNIDIPTTSFLKESISQKKNKIIITSSRTIYICSCHHKIFLSNQALGGHLKNWRKKMIQQNKIE